MGIAIGLLLCVFISAGAQDKETLQRKIECVLKDKEPDWMCKKSLPEGDAGPLRVYYNFLCSREGQQVNGSVYLLSSQQDAVDMLDRSQMMLQINKSKPQDGIGEQAYGFAGNGAAWITFRNANVFGQVDVSAIPVPAVAAQSPEMDASTRLAFDIAKRFAQHLVQTTHTQR
jgi:hypothetical protein